ncbi:UNVERIFIED_CONTAM: protein DETOXIFICATION 27 [Sesamum radiatum]|uniref:Protein DETOXIFICATION 27 n=1 Tax=Sesamum radiatum TaxID=300843 RepID=A0AAW2Q1V8_SESRA
MMVRMSVGHHQPLLLSISEDSENQINQQPHQPDPGSSASARYCVKEAWTECKKLWQIAAPSNFADWQCFLSLLSPNLLLATSTNATSPPSPLPPPSLSPSPSASCSEWLARLKHCVDKPTEENNTTCWLIGQPTLLAELTGEVAMWLIPMHLSFVFQFTLMRFLQCQLKTYVIAWVSGVVLVVHLLLSWIFVYRLRVGIVGAALTLDFSWWMSVLGMFIYCICGGCRNSWTGLSRQAFIGLWDFFKLALASGVMLSLENFYYRILVIVSGIRSAEVAVDALSICISFYGWESMIPLGLFAATGIRVANEIGAGNGNSAKFAAKVSVFNSLVVGFVFFLVIIAFPDKIAMIFTSSTSVISMVEGLALLLAITILFNCIQPILSGIAVGSGWQALVAYINIGSYYFVGVPLGIILGWLLQFGLKNIVLTLNKKK